MAPFYLSVSLNHVSVKVSQHAQYQNPEIEAANGYSAVINFIIHTCAFPAVTGQNVFCEKVLLA